MGDAVIQVNAYFENRSAYEIINDGARAVSRFGHALAEGDPEAIGGLSGALFEMASGGMGARLAVGAAGAVLRGGRGAVRAGLEVATAAAGRGRQVMAAGAAKIRDGAQRLTTAAHNGAREVAQGLSDGNTLRAIRSQAARTYEGASQAAGRFRAGYRRGFERGMNPAGAGQDVNYANPPVLDAVGRGLADGVRAVRRGAGAGGRPPIIIGENMTRVQQYADQVGGHAYRPWKNDPFDFGLGMRRNERWIRDQIRMGREIIDIGPDFQRRAATGRRSPFYEMERRNLDGYDKYRKVFERTGSRRGVPGLDF